MALRTQNQENVVSLTRASSYNFEWHYLFPEGVPLDFCCPYPIDQVREENKRMSRKYSFVVRTMFRQVHRQGQTEGEHNVLSH